VTDASKWRLTIARDIAEAYADEPNVKAVLMGRSVLFFVRDFLSWACCALALLAFNVCASPKPRSGLGDWGCVVSWGCAVMHSAA